MSLRQSLQGVLNRRVPETPVMRAFLELDNGALVEPTDYPYRTRGPIRPFGNRIALPLGNVHHDLTLFTPTTPGLRPMAHIPQPAARTVRHGATRDVAGADVPAKGYRPRPWLFGGILDMAAKRPADPGTPKAPCSGC